MASFCCYRLPPLAEPRGDGLGGYIEERSEIRAFGPERESGFEYVLYVAVSEPREPPWAELLSPVLGTHYFPERSGVGAVIIVRLEGDPDRCFAFTFGTGRFLLRDRRWTRAYGLRIAVNMLCAGATEGEPEDRRIMSTDSTRLTGERRRSRVQSARRATVDAFGLDRFRDVVKGMTVIPVDQVEWGPRVDGSDAIHFSGRYELPDLGTVCQQLDRVYERDDYRHDFGWLDDFKPVTDPQERERLIDHVLEMLQNGYTDDWELAPPDIVDWAEEIQGFRYPASPDGVQWLSLDDYLQQLSANKQRVSRSGMERKLTVVRKDGQEVRPWSLWACLTGELVEEGQTYVLDGGEFWAVEADFLKGLDTQVEALDAGNGGLPFARATDDEASYHHRVADSIGEPAVVLHGDLVHRPEARGAIEVCDVFTKSGRLFHFAWPRTSLSSRVLSHLFWQGQVSAFLLQDYPDFRAEAARKVDAKDARGNIESLSLTSFTPPDYEIVYGIIADWHSRSLARRLPFFSKVSLRATAGELSKRGFHVSCLRIEAQPLQYQPSLPGITTPPRGSSRSRPRKLHSVRQRRVKS
jgi:uncharacterized protein (TIGR04141 family)